MTEEVVLDGTLYALIVRHADQRPGIHFFTPGNVSQQLGYMSHPSGHQIRPHVHRDLRRDVFHTQEVLLLRKGKLKVNFYGSDGGHIESRVLEAGEVILLAGGGHGFEVIEACEMFEVKQGPYLGDDDKTLLPSDGAAPTKP